MAAVFQAKDRDRTSMDSGCNQSRFLFHVVMLVFLHAAPDGSDWLTFLGDLART